MITLILLGDLWLALGAYTEAQQGYEQAMAMVQTLHDPYWESWLHASYGRLQHLRGDPAAAQTACALARQIAQQDGIHVQEQWALVYLGHALAALGNHAVAGECYQQAIALHKQAFWVYRTVDAHAGLAELFLHQKEVAVAIAHVEAALTLLAQQGLAAATEPFRAYWTCYRVLKACGDARASGILQDAHQRLLAQAAKIDNEALRRLFLENVVANRELIALAQSTGTLCVSL